VEISFPSIKEWWWSFSSPLLHCTDYLCNTAYDYGIYLWTKNSWRICKSLCYVKTKAGSAWVATSYDSDYCYDLLFNHYIYINYIYDLLFGSLLLGAVIITNVINLITGLFDNDSVGIISNIIFGWGMLALMVVVSIFFYKKKWSKRYDSRMEVIECQQVQ
jgi:hypothetical protein